MKKFFSTLVMVCITLLASANIDPPKVEMPLVDGLIITVQDATNITMPGQSYTYEIANVMQYETTIWLSWSGGTMPGDRLVADSFSIVNQQTFELRDDLYRCCKLCYNYYISTMKPENSSTVLLLELGPGDRCWSVMTGNI